MQVRTRPSLLREVASARPDFVVWCDHKYALNEAAVWPVLASPRGAQAALWLFQHPSLQGGAETEVEDILLQPRRTCDVPRVRAYLARARAMGLVTEDVSLNHYATAVQVWDLRHPDAARLQATWWDHTVECALEDQVAVFVVQQLFPPGTLRPLPGNMLFESMEAPFESYNAFAKVL